MKRNVAKAFLAYVTFFILTGCPARPLTPPDNVPRNATWAGGADGGVWILCQDSKPEEQIFFCSVYGENGSLWREADFKIENADTLMANSTTHNTQTPYSAAGLHQIGFSYNDGRYIKLVNGVLLKRISEVTPP